MYSTIVDTYVHDIVEHKELRALIDDFVSSSEDVQHITSCSGNITSGGLAEPKYQVDGKTAFTGSWGRPQSGMRVKLRHLVGVRM